jgi:hypothetical protein
LLQISSIRLSDSMLLFLGCRQQLPADGFIFPASKGPMAAKNLN